MPGRVGGNGLDDFASVGGTNHAAPSTNQLALSATIHCLTGCAIGDVLGLVIATALTPSSTAITDDG